MEFFIFGMSLYLIILGIISYAQSNHQCGCHNDESEWDYDEY